MPFIFSPFRSLFCFLERAVLAARCIEVHSDGLYRRMRGFAHALLHARIRTRAGRC